MGGLGVGEGWANGGAQAERWCEGWECLLGWARIRRVVGEEREVEMVRHACVYGYATQYSEIEHPSFSTILGN